MSHYAKLATVFSYVSQISCARKDQISGKHPTTPGPAATAISETAAHCRMLHFCGGKVPPSREALEALPGVGRKTANVVLNIAFGEPTIAVDTHIFRVGNRTGLATGRTPFEVEEKLNAVVPDKYKRHAHHWLILHGRYVCVARRPLCEKCLISDLCKWPGKTGAP